QAGCRRCGMAAGGPSPTGRADAAGCRTHALGQTNHAAFLQALKQLGWVDGQNVRIENRWAKGETSQIRKNATDVLALAPDSGLAATNALIWMQFAHCLLARALLASGQFESALELVERILAEIGASGGRWYEAEIHRLKGDIHRGQGKSVSEIEPHYEAAIAVARRQRARAWEIR